MSLGMLLISWPPVSSLVNWEFFNYMRLHNKPPQNILDSNNHHWLVHDSLEATGLGSNRRFFAGLTWVTHTAVVQKVIWGHRVWEGFTHILGQALAVKWGASAPVHTASHPSLGYLPWASQSSTPTGKIGSCWASGGLASKAYTMSLHHIFLGKEITGTRFKGRRKTPPLDARGSKVPGQMGRVSRDRWMSLCPCR